MKMSKINKIFSILLFAFMSVLILNSCEEETPDVLAEKDGPATITYIRSTNPEISDSLYTGAFMGSLIAIVGDNLGDTKEIWFNDQKALLQPNYITDKSIIVSVPSTVPTEITDKMRIVFSDKSELLYDFKVLVPAPLVKTAKCEYVPEGQLLELTGDFFFNPVVTFQGGAQGKIISVEKTKMTVEVPAGALAGPVVVKTLFGSAASKWWFRENRGMILDLDNLRGGGWRTHDDRLQSAGGISGNYAVLEAKLEADNDWKDNWLEIDVWGQAGGRPAGPLFRGDINNLQLKFEANVVNNWQAGFMQFIFSPYTNNGNAVNTDPTIARGMWHPWYESATTNKPFKTDGWVTVGIPLSEFIYNDNKQINTLKLNCPDNCGSLTIFVRGPLGAVSDVKILIDNVRVVPL